MKDCPTIALGQLTTTINGLWTGKKPPFINIAVIRNTNFSKDCRLKMDDIAMIDVEVKQYASRKLQRGDIIIEKSGGSDKQHVGRPVLFDISDGEYSFSNFTSTLRVNDRETILPEYLHKFLYKFYLSGNTAAMQSKTTGLRNLDFNAYRAIKVPVPSIEEQQRIVDELDLLTGIIDKKNAQLRDLDALAQSTFYEMFGDPSESKYPVAKLSSLATGKLSYGSGASAIIFDGQTRYVRITDIQEDGRLSPDAMSPSQYDAKYLLNDGDILFARSGATVGKTYLYDSKDGNAIYAGYLIRLVPNQEIVLPEYIYHFTRSHYYRAFIASNVQAVAQPNINAQQYGNLSVCVPPISEQKVFAEEIHSLESKRDMIWSSIKDTQTLLDSRMSHYFG